MEFIKLYQMTDVKKSNDVDSIIESLISSYSKNTIQLLCTICVLNIIVQSLSSPKLVLICLNSAIQNAYVVGPNLRHKTMNLLIKRNLLG